MVVMSGMHGIEETVWFLEMNETVEMVPGSCQWKMIRVNGAGHKLTRSVALEEVLREEVKTMMMVEEEPGHLKKGVLKDDHRTVTNKGMEQEQTVKLEIFDHAAKTQTKAV